MRLAGRRRLWRFMPAWGEQLALRMLGEAGFVELETHEAVGDPMDAVYLARKPG